MYVASGPPQSKPVFYAGCIGVFILVVGLVDRGIEVRLHSWHGYLLFVVFFYLCLVCVSIVGWRQQSVSIWRLPAARSERRDECHIFRHYGLFAYPCMIILHGIDPPLYSICATFVIYSSGLHTQSDI